MIVETLAIDGEFLAIKHFNFPYNDFGFALELVDVEVLDVENNQTLRNGNTIKWAWSLTSGGVRSLIIHHNQEHRFRLSIQRQKIPQDSR